MKLHGSSIIGGNPAERSGQHFNAVNPKGGGRLDPNFHEATPSQVNAALRLAEDCSDAFRRSPAEQRICLLEEIASEILGLGDALLERAHVESGLPLERLAGERGRTVGQLRMFADLIRDGSWRDARIDTALPDRKPLPRPDLRRMLVPIGPVVVFGASNFPLAFSVSGGDTASALAAGCPVIVKGHPAHPGTSELVATAIAKAAKTAALPDGVFSLLQGASPALGLSLVQHKSIRAVGFTGSHKGGRALFDAACLRPDPIPVFAEMSSLNPVFILPDTLRINGPLIAAGLKNSLTLGVGQFCTKPGVIIGIAGADMEAFKSMLCTEIKGAAAGTMLHEGIRSHFLNALEAALANDAAKVLARSECELRDAENEALPALLVTSGKSFLAAPLLQHEIFGPAGLLVEVRDESELLEVANHLEGQLTATVHGTAPELAQARALFSILERKAGRVLVNGFPTGVEVSPAMQHGGPYPSSTDSRFSSVGTAAIQRWVRPVCFQNFPRELLPAELKDENPMGVMRLLNGNLTRDGVH